MADVIRKRDLDRAKAWCVSHYRLDGWKLSFEYTDVPPVWLHETGHEGSPAWYRCDLQLSTATVWISPKMCSEQGCCPMGAMFHEMAHLGLTASSIGQTHVMAEFMVDRIADMARFSYENGLTPWGKVDG